MEPMKFVKKPVIVEAMRFKVGRTFCNGDEIARWCGGRFNYDTTIDGGPYSRYSISIPTLEGVMTARPGDLVIRGVAGEFYPCKPDIFEETYKAVE